MSEPSLVSNDTKFFLSETLKQCHKIKENYYSYIYNVCAFIFLILLFGTILIVKYRGKPTEQEKNEKNNKQKEYILSKIKIMQDIKRQKSQDLITNLPKWETDEDIFNRKIYR
jgi:heme/copper-type cytochrome/quinol oxidase subunit 2